MPSSTPWFERSNAKRGSDTRWLAPNLPARRRSDAARLTPGSTAEPGALVHGSIPSRDGSKGDSATRSNNFSAPIETLPIGWQQESAEFSSPRTAGRPGRRSAKPQSSERKRREVLGTEVKHPRERCR